MRTGFLPTLACLLLAAGPSFALNDLLLDIRLKSFTDAEPPVVGDEVILFTYRPDGPVRHVAARFAHEGFGVLHPYTRNANGIFVLDYPRPEEPEVLRYRIVVDGLWMPDPANPTVSVDAYGDEFSLVKLGKSDLLIVNPRREKDGRALFRYTGETGKAIALVGDFNNWDPFIDRLQENEPGVYEVAVRIRPGLHGYYFLIDGERRLDPRNFEVSETRDGLAVSSFSWPPAAEHAREVTAATTAKSAAKPSPGGH